MSSFYEAVLHAPHLFILAAGSGVKQAFEHYKTTPFAPWVLGPVFIWLDFVGIGCTGASTAVLLSLLVPVITIQAKGVADLITGADNITTEPPSWVLPALLPAMIAVLCGVILLNHLFKSARKLSALVVLSTLFVHYALIGAQDQTYAVINLCSAVTLFIFTAFVSFFSVLRKFFSAIIFACAGGLGMLNILAGEADVQRILDNLMTKAPWEMENSTILLAVPVLFAILCQYVLSTPKREEESAAQKQSRVAEIEKQQKYQPMTLAFDH